MSSKRLITYLVVHTSATPASADIGAKEIDRWHRAKGWLGIGYHFVIRRDGTVETGRPVDRVGAHVQGYNKNSIGICMVGGVDENGHDMGNYTPEQFVALFDLLTKLKADYPTADIRGHRDFSPDLNGDGKITSNEWIKLCPCFDVRSWWEGMNSPKHPLQQQQ